ncbi:unnamed protein product [Cuscuta campestris]|uniref:Uncharacterized protein n=1 Tax=Cuscuta campestris TaxID=132261 RepID=A0A484NAF5_9ASTE|nr:unnamed protein product [Cuscuta campestris]
MQMSCSIFVSTISGLHNFLRKEYRSDEFPPEPELKSSSSSYLNMEEENFDILSQTQQQQRTEANAWRHGIAEAMWGDRPQNDANEENEEAWSNML